MNKMLIATLLATGLFVGILILLEVGRRLGGKRLALDPRARGRGLARSRARSSRSWTADRLYLLGRGSRFDARRDLMVQETNAIGTAWLRLDLLPPAPNRRFGRVSGSMSIPGWRSTANCPISRHRGLSWPGRRGCRGKSGPRRSRPGDWKAPRHRRRCCCCRR